VVSFYGGSSRYRFISLDGFVGVCLASVRVLVKVLQWSFEWCSRGKVGLKSMFLEFDRLHAKLIVRTCVVLGRPMILSGLLHGNRYC
jgi:hypothetical protein